MRYVSLFSGIGGFDLGFDRAGMECAAQVEIDEKALEVLDRHWPDVPKFRDVRSFGNGQFKRGAVDLVCGGFPCQDLSVAGKRAGLAGERSGLWFEFARVIDELEPRWVVIENVPGLLSSGGGADFAVILQWLVRRGYGVAWRVLDAQYFGVPQRRRRVFIVASLGSGRAAEVLFESESLPGDPPPGGEAGKEVAFTLRADASHSGDKGDRGINTTLIPDPVIAAYGGNNTSGPIDLATARSTKNNRMDFESDTFVVNQRGGFGIDVDDSGVAPTLQAEGGSHTGGPGRLPLVFQQNTRDEVRLMDGDGQLCGERAAQPGMKQQNYVAFTERTRAGGRQLEYQENLAYALTNPGDGGRAQERNIAGPFGVRRLTPVECARLQGFPDDWNDWLADTARYSQYGNAVAVPVAEWLGKRIKRAEE